MPKRWSLKTLIIALTVIAAIIAVLGPPLYRSTAFKRLEYFWWNAGGMLFVWQGSEGYTLVGPAGFETSTLREIERIPNLKLLDLSRSSVSDTEVAALCNNDLAELVGLGLNDTAVGDGALRNIERLGHLHYLHLRNTSVTDDAVEYLGRLQNLIQLDINGSQISPDGCLSLQEMMPNTEVLFCETD